MLKPALAALLSASVLMGCSREPKPNSASTSLAFNDFENLDGWLADSPALATLSRDKAHSGVYSTMIGPGHDFSLGYNNALSRLASEWPTKITVGAWVYLPNSQASAKLVTEVKPAGSPGPGLLWQAIDLTSTAKSFGKWQYVEQTVAMPATAKPESRLLVYLWRADSKEPVYLDDLKITLAGR